MIIDKRCLLESGQKDRNNGVINRVYLTNYDGNLTLYTEGN